MAGDSAVQSFSKTLDQTRQCKKITRLLAEGKNNVQIAEVMGCDQSAIWYWRQRHPEYVAEAEARMLAEVADYAIANKVQRIADYDQLRTLLTAAVEDGGATYIEETRHGSKRHLNPAVPELRATLQQAALELDQLPRAGVTVNNQNVVIVRQVSGPDTGGNPEL